MRQRIRSPLEAAGRINGTPMNEEARRSLNILVADDRKTCLRLMAITLGDIGHTAITARDGLEALDIFLNCRERGISIDFVITDYRMPGMDGLRLTRALRNLDPALPILIMTATPSLVDRDACRKAGALDVMEKEYTSEQLDGIIKAGQKQ